MYLIALANLCVMTVILHANECDKTFIIHYHNSVMSLLTQRTEYNLSILIKAHCGCYDITQPWAPCYNICAIVCDIARHGNTKILL